LYVRGLLHVRCNTVLPKIKTIESCTKYQIELSTRHAERYNKT